MELRPELSPPGLDKELVVRLAALAERLDGVRADECGGELAEFNRLAGTTLTHAGFQNIHASARPVEFVRRVLFQRHVTRDPKLTRAELAQIISQLMTCAPDHDFYLELFLTNCRHPSGNGLIFWPSQVPELPQDREPTAAEIADLAMRDAD
jgi:hypothetical protein